ncbi:hypothetical protein HX004_14010 [Myroides sp. 1354]|nr:hypothetical protein [Myroides sp. R163-1]MDM1056879.1 hypothetical protein [Myroides sp. 1354]MDM1070074.1 hypothetical protein [Myroides sp. 1372]
MYDMNWQISFKNSNELPKSLLLLESVEINCDVDNLTDTAQIILPESVMNRVWELDQKIVRGTEVIIYLGYNDDLQQEFTGYVQRITNDGSLIIHCEDAFFLFRVSVPDKEFKNVSLEQIVEYLVKNVDDSFTIACDYGITYEKFTIHQATAFDVLKKLQDETKGNIYFDNQNKVLHLHPAYTEVGNQVRYSYHKNIEKANLEYKKKEDKKVEITIESTDSNGKVKSITIGTTGGDKKTLKVGPMSEADMRKIAENALIKQMYDGFEGTFDGWLVPVVKPTDSAHIEDLDYPYKTGNYYVKAVTTKFDSSGGVRTVKLGIRLN